MRRNHMNMMFDHRTQAVHEGVRTEKFSLAGCVSCHAVNGSDNKPVAYASDKHFCRSCHAYAAVSIDCFECHESTPDEPAKTANASERQDEEQTRRPSAGGQAMSRDGNTGGSRRDVLFSAMAGVVMLAPGMTLPLLAPAQAKPAGEPVSAKTRWGILIDASKCTPIATPASKPARRKMAVQHRPRRDRSAMDPQGDAAATARRPQHAHCR